MKYPICKCGTHTTKEFITHSLHPQYYCPTCKEWRDTRWDKLDFEITNNNLDLKQVACLKDKLHRRNMLCNARTREIEHLKGILRLNNVSEVNWK